tara:strand:+ start:240 stop:2084 length:1845 start_codon:yes stop_codon:yes gene_type:complete
MKYIYVLLSALILVSCSQEVEITKNQIQTRDGLIFKVNQQLPFTGIVTSSYSNQQVREYFQIVNGRYSGKYLTYYQNGQIKSKGDMKRGNGEVIHYDKNNKEIKINYFFDNKLDPYEILFIEGQKYFNLKESNCEQDVFSSRGYESSLIYCASPKSLISYYLNTKFRKKICEGAVFRCNNYDASPLAIESAVVRHLKAKSFKEATPTKITLNENTIDGWVITSTEERRNASDTLKLPELLLLESYWGNAFHTNFVLHNVKGNTSPLRRHIKAYETASRIGPNGLVYSETVIVTDTDRIPAVNTISYEGDKQTLIFEDGISLLNKLNEGDLKEYDKEDFASTIKNRNSITKTAIFYEKSVITINKDALDNVFWYCDVWRGDKYDYAGRYTIDLAYPSSLNYPQKIFDYRPTKRIRTEAANFSDFSSYLQRIGCLELLNEEQIKSFYQKIYTDKEQEEKERLQREKEEEKERLEIEKIKKELLQREKKEKEEKERLENEKYQAELSFWRELQVIEDKEHVLIREVQPTYPRRAIENGIGGYVIVAFTVDKSGLVDDPYIVEAKCRAGEYDTLINCSIFNQPSLKAALMLVYQPVIRDGLKVSVDGVQHKFTFEIEK